MAVPPLRHRILHAGEGRVALGAAEGDRHSQVVDDMQDRHDQDEGHVVPVRHIDVRFLAAGQRADKDQEIDNPDNHQPEVGIPFRLRIFLGLGDAQEIAAGCNDAEEIVADQHEPGAQLVGQPGARRSLQDVEGGGDQGISAEAEDDAAGVDRPQPAEARPGGVEGQLRPGQKRRNPNANEHGDDSPEHGEDNAHLGRIVIVVLEQGPVRRRRIPFGDNEAAQRQREKEHGEALDAKRLAATRGGHGKSYRRHDKADDKPNLPFGDSQLGHARSAFRVHERRWLARLIRAGRSCLCASANWPALLAGLHFESLCFRGIVQSMTTAEMR